MAVVVRNHYIRTSADLTWPWELTGPDGSAIKEYGDSVRQRIADAKTYAEDNFSASFSYGEIDDLNTYVDVTFPDQASYDAHADYVNTDPDWFPAVPATFGISRSNEILP